MEKGFEFWFQSQQIDPNMLSAPNFRHRLSIPSLGNMLSSNGNPPEFAFPASKAEEPCGWFHGLTPVVNSIPKRQVTEPVQKKFLVFDQSNDRTTLIYSSIPIPYHLPEPQFKFDMRKEVSVMEKHEDTRSSDSFHEDTEELEALLYSDDDNSEDEEEQSTGHSPVMGSEEVASSLGGCMKRRKLDSGGGVEDTASSGVNCSVSNGVADSRKEKVRETISVLQNLIPGGKNGKDAMVILDEAINYLRILKVKAKALGLDSL